MRDNSERDNFEKDIYNSKVRLYEPQLLEAVISDVYVPYDEELAKQKQITDICLYTLLTKEDYWMYHLRKKRYKLDDIGKLFNIKKSATCIRLQKIEQKINEFTDKINGYQTANRRLEDLEKILKSNL